MSPDYVLINDGEQYSGLYVATASFEDKDVKASDKTPVEVHTKMLQMGFKEPFIFYVPDKNMVHIY